MHQKLRLIALQHQGLNTSRAFGLGSQAVQQAIEHLGYIQIDTLAIIERAHHHTLWTRIPDYQPNYLQQLVRERCVFEYWFHAASFLPMRDYRFVLPQMEAIKRGESPYASQVEAKYINHVLDRIRIDGPLKARDFETSKKGSSNWWNWKPTKRALEKLFMQGDLMVADRDGMEKVYDLRERVLPDGTDTTEPSLQEFSEYLINQSIRANGLTTLKQLTHLRSGEVLRKTLQAMLNHKVEQNSLIEYRVEQMPPIYTTQEILDLKIRRPTSNVRLLSPFDNAIIHRDRMQALFEFDYRLECYTAKEKRQYGYFCLPILYKDRLVGRVDCKAHRKDGEFELIHLHIESKQIDLDSFMPSFTKTVLRFAIFNRCPFIRLSQVSPKKLSRVFRQAFNAVETVS
ncbi:MAG: winged helix DNA-binding domain-containing protein [Gammaproteobacteria bacterium]|nr:winged helix DNA-binding domain-containing protein [Gammaproteobacteria bacterium]